MSFTAETLYRLLPSIHAVRDQERGAPLRAFVEVLAEQAQVVEAELEGLYDDQFIETCAEWVIPYLGDLLGVRGLDPLDKALVDARTRALLSPRAQVANAIALP